MSIEDSAALARHVGTALAAGAGASAIDEALFFYERERRPLNAAVIRSSHWMSRLFALGGPLGDAFHRWILELADSSLGRVLQKQIWSRFSASPEPQYA